MFMIEGLADAVDDFAGWDWLRPSRYVVFLFPTVFFSFSNF